MKSFLDIQEPQEKPKRKLSLTRLIVVLCAFGMVSVGTTLAARISLNSNAPVEFGQGVLATTACDSNGMKISPFYSFLNDPDIKKFSFNAIQIEQISGNCAGKDLLIKVYDASGEPITLTNDSQNPATEIRIYFHPMYPDLRIAQSDGDANTVSSYGHWAEQFSLIGNSPTNVEAIGDLTAITVDEPQVGAPAQEYFAIDEDENSVQIALDPSGEFISGFSDSRNVYKITIESKDHIV